MAEIKIKEGSLDVRLHNAANVQQNCNHNQPGELTDNNHPHGPHQPPGPVFVVFCEERQGHWVPIPGKRYLFVDGVYQGIAPLIDEESAD